MTKFVSYMFNTAIYFIAVMSVLSLMFAMAPAAKAAPAKQRVSILKYYLCLANPTVVDKSLCHL